MGRNPQMEKLKMMSDMMKKRQKATTTPTTTTTTTTTQQPRKSPNTSSSDTSPLEEHAPNGVDAQGDGSRMARSSASSKLQVPYPEHLSTIRHDKSPVPPPSESSLSSGASGEKRVRADSENSSRKQNDNTESAIDYRKLYEDERLKNETHKKQNSDYTREIIRISAAFSCFNFELSALTSPNLRVSNSKLAIRCLS